jgi:hypothetical protein
MAVIATIEQLEAIYGFPGESSTVKVADYITPSYRLLIEKIAVRGAGDLRPRRARLLAARRSSRLCSHPRRQDADDAGPPRQQPHRFPAQHRA